MRLLLSELLKIRTAPRTLIGLMLAELVIVAIGTASTISSATSAPEGLPGVTVSGPLPPHLERDLISLVGSALLFGLVLGILVVTWEYRHGTITQTFLASPLRERVLGAKLVVAALAGALLVIPALLLMFTIAEIWVGGREGFHFGGGDFRLVARLFLAAAFVGILGAEIGAGTGRQLGALVGTFVWIAFAEPALSIWHGVRDYLPLHGGLMGVFGTDSEAPSFERGLLVTGAYVLALGAIGLAAMLRRDIT